MEVIVALLLIITGVYLLSRQFYDALMLLKAEQQSQQGDNGLEQGWHDLGAAPMPGDEADLGTIDIAIHIQDIIWHLQDDNPPEKQQALEQQLQAHYYQLFEITLLAAGEAPDYSLYEAEDAQQTQSNIIDLNHYRTPDP